METENTSLLGNILNEPMKNEVSTQQLSRRASAFSIESLILSKSTTEKRIPGVTSFSRSSSKDHIFPTDGDARNESFPSSIHKNKEQNCDKIFSRCKRSGFTDYQRDQQPYQTSGDTINETVRDDSRGFGEEIDVNMENVELSEEAATSRSAVCSNLSRFYEQFSNKIENDQSLGLGISQDRGLHSMDSIRTDYNNSDQLDDTNKSDVIDFTMYRSDRSDNSRSSLQSYSKLSILKNGSEYKERDSNQHSSLKIRNGNGKMTPASEFSDAISESEIRISNRSSAHSSIDQFSPGGRNLALSPFSSGASPALPPSPPSSKTPKNESVLCRLDPNDLWQKFYELGTEMIITKTGRRMFPTLRLSFSGLLDWEGYYAVALDILPVDRKRYRYAYHRSSWVVAGKADPQQPSRLYVHPDSPFTGQQLLQQSVSFEKLKLTNNPVDKNGHIVLNSMHKYQPRIHLIRLPNENFSPTDIESLDELDHETFICPETMFIAVTAYQNQLITKLKIDSNPFAKGFRDSSRPCTEFERETLQLHDLASNPVVAGMFGPSADATGLHYLRSMLESQHRHRLENFNSSINNSSKLHDTTLPIIPHPFPRVPEVGAAPDIKNPLSLYHLPSPFTAAALLNSVRKPFASPLDIHSALVAAEALASTSSRHVAPSPSSTPGSESSTSLKTKYAERNSYSSRSEQERFHPYYHTTKRY